MINETAIIRGVKMVMLIALPLLVVILFSLWRSAKNEQQQTAENYAALNRVHAVTVDKLGRQTRAVSAIRADAKQLLAMEVHKSDSLSRKLQQVVKSAKGNTKYAAVIQSATTGRITAKTDTVKPLEYRAVLLDPYTEATIVARADSVILEYKYKSELHVWHTYRNPLFGKPEYKTFIQDQNPNARITDAVTYEAPAPKPRRGVWVAVGAIGTLITIFALK